MSTLQAQSEKAKWPVLLVLAEVASFVGQAKRQETGVATHVGNYTETVWLNSPTTGNVEIKPSAWEKLSGTVAHLSPTEVEVATKNGTGRRRGEG